VRHEKQEISESKPTEDQRTVDQATALPNTLALITRTSRRMLILYSKCILYSTVTSEIGFSPKINVFKLNYRFLDALSLL
jgi:hypothetical protein